MPIKKITILLVFCILVLSALLVGCVDGSPEGDDEAQYGAHECADLATAQEQIRGDLADEQGGTPISDYVATWVLGGTGAAAVSATGCLIAVERLVAKRLEALEEENEQLRERVEALAAELDDRLEDDERERDATRRLLWRD